MVIACVDCNNFFVSCERVFNPKLESRPVAVMSNNDGCIVARSQEVKKLGIPMGAPVHQYKDVIQTYRVILFSANFTLYGDMSQRVMRTLARFTPDIEIYSIDEAFLDLDGIPMQSPTEYGTLIRNTVKQWTGIPVSVGIAKTKTLSKAANELAKKNPEYEGVLDLSADEPKVDVALKRLDVQDVWGIGRRRADFLKRRGIHTAFDLKYAPEKWIRQNLSVMGQRTVLELRGIACFELEELRTTRKSVASTRSFGKPVTRLEELKQSVALYITRSAEKLRAQKSAANIMQIFIRTNVFQKHKAQYIRCAVVTLPVATNYTPELVKHAMPALERIYLPGYEYAKAGVIFSGLVPQDEVQLNLFAEALYEDNRRQTLMATIDKLNWQWGKDVVKLARTGLRREWKMKQNRLSNRYTTDWNGLVVAKAV